MNNLYKRIEEELGKKERVVVAIDGMCAAGKSSLAKELKELFKATVFHMDDFFLPFERKTVDRMNEPGGNVDYERIYTEIHSRLEEDVIFFDRYSCKDGNLYSEKAELGNLIVIEGVYSMRPEFRKFYDLAIFMEIETEEQINRVLKRNGENMISKFVYEWIPMENKYFKILNVKDACDVVLGE
ncbi:uridine kinase [Mycoplasmatota bacterium WC44]